MRGHAAWTETTAVMAPFQQLGQETPDGTRRADSKFYPGKCRDLPSVTGIGEKRLPPQDIPGD
jgi:hypothetical protein